jgi:hypothetical protein
MLGLPSIPGLHQPQPYPRHSPAGGEAVHSINSGHDASLDHLVRGSLANSLGMPMPIRGRASKHIVLDPRVSKDDAQKRFAERDQRLANDTRTEAQKWLNDPAPGRSALAQHSQGSNGAGNFPAPTQRSAGTRVDLWKFR